jgi:septum formation protein
MKNKNNHEIILASSSPQRIRILENAGFGFRVVPHGTKEKVEKKLSPSELVVRLASQKARAVYERLKKNGASQPGKKLILGADTIVVLKGRVIGKPKDKKHAEAILRALSGSKHYVYTGIALIDLSSGKTCRGYEKTAVYFKNLDEHDIIALREKNHDKAGAYAVQAEEDIYVRKIEGDYLNVVGFPLKKFRKMLKGMK